MESDVSSLGMRWDAGGQFAELRVNLATAMYALIFSTPAGERRWQFASAPARPVVLQTA